MNLKDVKRAMIGTSLYIVTGEDGFQWMGDGQAFYIVDQNIDLTERNLLAILDIEEDKREKYNVRELMYENLPQLDVCPQEDADEMLHPLVSVSWAGRLVTMMTTDGGEAVAVRQSRIAPADGRKKLAFFLRKSADPETGEIKAPCVAVYDDMLCCAVIMPETRKTVDEIWTVMRKACGEDLTYCLAEDEATERSEPT